MTDPRHRRHGRVVDRGRGRRLPPVPHPGEAGQLPRAQPAGAPVRRPAGRHGRITKAGPRARPRDAGRGRLVGGQDARTAARVLSAGPRPPRDADRGRRDRPQARRAVLASDHQGRGLRLRRPSLVAQKLRKLELRAGMPSRRGQRGSTARLHLKEVRAARTRSQRAGRAAPTASSSPTGRRTRARERAWPPPMGRDSEAVKRQTCAAGLPSPRPALRSGVTRARPDSTTEEATNERLTFSSVLRSFDQCAAGKA